tara:strand:- start:133 stop:600 length:468 start_codon:yes stop_codon:yes gene_type:complete
MKDFKITIGVAIATFFGVGKFPFASGTFGALFALPLIWILHSLFGAIGIIGFAIILLFAGIWASEVYIAISDKKDPSPVVIDEVVGQAIAISFIPLGLIEYALAFLLFRFFDVTKIWPANWAEKRPNAGLAVMLDDVIAGLYAGAMSLIILRLMS